jgi:hypothetical protein
LESGTTAKAYAEVFKKYPQMTLQMRREALEKIDRHGNVGRGLIQFGSSLEPKSP